MIFITPFNVLERVSDCLFGFLLTKKFLFSSIAPNIQTVDGVSSDVDVGFAITFLLDKTDSSTSTTIFGPPRKTWLSFKNKPFALFSLFLIFKIV